MIGKLIVSHGGLAEELLATAQRIAGPVEKMDALSLDWNLAPTEVEDRIREAISRLDDGDGVLILCAMFGDTPCNVTRPLLRPGRIELVSGVNLPLVVRLACASDAPTSVSELARWSLRKARSGIQITSGEGDCGEHGG